MDITDRDLCKLVGNIMRGKKCQFDFKTVSQDDLEKMLQCLY